VRTFTAVVRTTLDPAAAFAAITDWPAHGRHVPFTTVRVTRRTDGVGTTFTGTTGLGRLSFDDPMEVVRWEPPQEDGHGVCTIHKRGVVRGAAHIEVRADGAGARVSWTEGVAFGPRWLDPVVSRLALLPGRVVFGGVARRILRDAERARG
jgi:hypothetical protein